MSIHLDIYSPVQQLSLPLYREKGVQVNIKRDDMIHPIISGNKWRKLKHLLAKAQNEGKTHLVTFGGAYSNHLLATAAAAAKFGFKSTAFLRGEEVQNDTLFLCHLHGMQLIFVDRDAYRDKPGLFNSRFANNAEAMFIDEGGASVEAAAGCAELVSELTETYDHIFCACGTGTTAAGIVNGLQQQHPSTRFHGVPVFKNGEFMRDEINRFLVSPADYELHTNFHFGGYAKSTPQLTDFIKKFVANTGILIEPVYTGKMMFALHALIANDHFTPDSKILAIHTGGIWGLLGMKDRFAF